MLDRLRNQSSNAAKRICIGRNAFIIVVYQIQKRQEEPAGLAFFNCVCKTLESTYSLEQLHNPQSLYLPSHY